MSSVNKLTKPRPVVAPADEDREVDGLSRRRWLQLMGASLALAGAGGCRWEKTELLPFAKRPPGRTPGKVEKFATAMELGGSALGLMVTCVDGRPIKIEGNPKHPYSLGATNAFAQAAILELYDPDRSKNIIERTPEGDVVRTWNEFAAFAKGHFGELRKTGGKGFAVLAEPSCSPTLETLGKNLLATLPKAKWYKYDPIDAEGSSFRCRRYPVDQAEVIVSFDADLFGDHPAAVRHAHDFAKCRGATGGAMNRLYVIESCYTITGAVADHRLALCDQHIQEFVEQLFRELIPAEKRKASTPEPPRNMNDPAVRFLQVLARDIRVHQGKCVFVAGRRQLGNAEMRASDLNEKFGTLNRTYFPGNLVRSLTRSFGGEQWEALDVLALGIRSGEVKTLLILGGNPAYNAPVDLGLANLLPKVETAIHLSLYRNETSRSCTWHVPQAHFLESWGDTRSDDGVYATAQPLIAPLWDGRSTIELLALLSEPQPLTASEYVTRTFNRLAGELPVAPPWHNVLHDGCWIERERIDVDFPPSLNPPRPANAPSGPSMAWNDHDLELIFRPDSKLYDGRFANNSWLQEMPDPMTKLTWDNAALMSPATAEKLGVAHEDVVKLRFKGREVEAPVYVMPGQADGTVAVSLGYGRTAAGKVGGSAADDIAPVGFDAYKLRTTDALWFGTGLVVEPTGKKHRFATTHDRYWIDKVGFEGRAERVGELARETTLEEYRKQPLSPLPQAGERTGWKSLWQEPEYNTGHRWGMTIDLSRCVGCGACVMACQAENNVPVVGREQVLRGREMHWLRIDRYFQDQPTADGTRSVPATMGPKVVFQPLPCQQCEMAPCEQVCPVGATVHSKEGLNDMAYNRCIGVRYCANNCPFKVRRFNFFNYHKDLEDPANEVQKMVYNPEVTVRSRGVMEKCTYCVQRIQAAKIEAKNHRQATIPDGQIKTACQQVCPAGAIVFGDLNDKDSAVAKLRGSPRAYQMLAELKLKPRTSYLARIRNPNPELEDV